MNKNQIPDILNDPKRLNVALSRARKKLIILGDWNKAENSTILKNLKDYAISNNKANYIDEIKHALKKTTKYLYSRKDNIPNIIKEIKFKSNKFLYYHLPATLIFFGLLYLVIPIFYTYDKQTIQKAICKSENVECIIKGKVTYNFFPTPRLKIKDLTINIHSNKKITLLTANDASLKLSIKNLLAKDKHKFKKIILSNFEANINLKRSKNYYSTSSNF